MDRFTLVMKKLNDVNFLRNTNRKILTEQLKRYNIYNGTMVQF